MEEQKKNILVIDDEEDIIYCLKNFLIRKGYAVEGASSGEAALKKLEQKKADLIILDIVMPGLQGTELAKIVREKYPDIKILVATAFPKGSEVLSRDNLMEGMVTKPYRLQELYEKLEEIINLPETAAKDKEKGPLPQTRLLFVKAKLLFVEPSLEDYEFLYKQFKELTSRGQYYDLDLATNEEELLNKVKFSEPDIVIIEDSYLAKLDPNIRSKIFFSSKKTSEVTSFDLASAVKDVDMLEKIINEVRKLCIQYDLVTIR